MSLKIRRSNSSSLRGPPDPIIISTPANCRHQLSVTPEFDWNVSAPEIFKHKIGEGYGSVYIAEYSGYPIAVKVVDTDDKNSELASDIQILKDCTHPNIVNYFGSYVAAHQLHVLLEYCEFGSIRDILELTERTFFEKEIAFVCREVLQALLFLHKQATPIVHKDVKASNILVTASGEIKLADFAIAHRLNDEARLVMIEGTPHWMAPEIASASGCNTNADIWSLGITLIEMADGNPPYSDMHRRRAMYITRRQPPPTLSTPKKWSAEFNDFVSRCLIKDPHLRPSAATLLDHPFLQGVSKRALYELCNTVAKKKREQQERASRKVSSVAPNWAFKSFVDHWHNIFAL